MVVGVRGAKGADVPSVDKSSHVAKTDRLSHLASKNSEESVNSEDISILGGSPAFDSLMTVGRPNVPDREAFLERIGSMLDSRQFTNNGPMVREFESRVADEMWSRHCVAICNATVGLELTIHALGLTGEVIVPSFTFVATVHALQRLGIRPVFCDVDPRTHCLDPDAAARLVTPETSGILGVSLWGNYDGEAALRELADKHGLKFMLDSAHAVGCSRENGSFQRLCDAEVLSFHATKCIQALEGGAVLTDDDALAEKLRFLVNFGFSGEDRVLDIGTNGKMNEAEAAMGLTSLDMKDRIFAQNASNLAAYAVGLEGVPGVFVHTRSAAVQHNCHYVVTEIDAEAFGLSRDELVAALRLENVLARRYFYPGVHRMEPYSRLYPNAGDTLPVTEALAGRVMVLPNGMEISRDDIARLTSRIVAIQRRAGDVREALATCQDPRLPEFFT